MTTEPTEQHRQAARAINIGSGCFCGMRNPNSICLYHQDIATALASTEAAAFTAGRDEAKRFALETCDNKHDYAFEVDKKKPRCPFCLAQGLELARADLQQARDALADIRDRDDARRFPRKRGPTQMTEPVSSEKRTLAR